MTISEINQQLLAVETVSFELENGTFVPENFHITEVGKITKHFIDCGGTVRTEEVANFQLWDANDFDHRLKPQKLINIIELATKKLQIDENLQIEVEFQAETIGKYDLGFNGKNFVLLAKKTNCLAQGKCGIPAEKIKTNITNIDCKPNSGCC
jgi:hypothetical protein